jgi:hypothetical protein
MIFNEELATQLLAQATEARKAHPLPEGDDFFDVMEEWDAFEDDGGECEYDPIMSEDYYRNWLAKREAKRAKKTAADHERETRAATMAFYMNEDNILNERSLWED